MLGTSKGYKYIEQVTKAVNNIDTYVIKGSGERLVERMERRQEIFESKELSKLTKLKQITAWREYDLTTYGYGQRELLESRKLALKHTIQLVNGILQFDKVVKNGANLDYSRTVDGFQADMRVVEKGFMLSIKDGDKTLLNVVVGCHSLLHSTSWVDVSEQVKENVDLGLWRRNYGISSDMFEVEYKVETSNIDRIIKRIKQSFIENGLLTHVRGGEGWEVRKAFLGRSSNVTYDDVICLHKMYYGLHESEFQLALDIVNEIVKEEGYTKPYER
ncbi:hypothetical protein ACQUY5_16600 [Bacillus cereus]|uniref:hypothetical protein n=1 Tax=Bacillus cereus TaxID=1396 RepID=UPI003D16EE1D